MKTISFAFALTILLTGWVQPMSTTPPAELVSIATILAHPEKYDGSLVRIRGAAVVRFEASYVCDKVEMIDAGQSEKCLWLTPGIVGNKFIDLKIFHGKVVELIGRFDRNDRGHMNAYGGTIAPSWGKVLRAHGHGDVPPPPPPPQ